MAPNYSNVARRGEVIGRGIQDIFNIIAQTVPSAVQEYKTKRNNEFAYKHIRKNIIDNQEKYGLSDSQADAFANKLKYKDGEKVEDYEKRVAPALLNMKIWEEYTKDPNYKIDLPDPFMENKTFVAMLDHSLKKKEQKDIGQAVQDVVFGGRKGGLPVGTDISNIQEDIKTQDPSTYQPPEQGVTQAGTQEEATSMLGARMGNRPVSEKQLQQFPAYRSLPSEAGMAKGQQTQADLEKTQAQTEAAKALANQRKTATMIDKLKSAKNKQGEVNNLKDLNTITRLEIAAKESLKDIPKYGLDELGMAKESGPISEDWIDMKELADQIKTRRTEIVKAGGGKVSSKIVPGMEAKAVSNKVADDIAKIYPKGAKDETALTALSVDRLVQFASSRGVKIDPGRIEAALKQGNTIDDIAQRIIMATQKQGE